MVKLRGFQSRGEGSIPSAAIISSIGQVVKLLVSQAKDEGSTPSWSIGVSPSGKAQDFDSCIRWFKSSYPSYMPMWWKWYTRQPKKLVP